MKKVLSLILCLAMVLCMSVTAFAENPTSATTAVKYEGLGDEAYTVTVPEKLAPNDSATVTLKGTWATDRRVSVIAPETVLLTNDINENDTKTLTVTFDDIVKTGDNTVEKTYTETIAIGNITDALFGNWTGIITYTVEASDAN